MTRKPGWSTKGPNRLDAPRHRSPIRRFAAQFNNVLIYILIGAAVLNAILGEWVDFAVTRCGCVGLGPGVDYSFGQQLPPAPATGPQSVRSTSDSTRWLPTVKPVVALGLPAVAVASPQLLIATKARPRALLIRRS